MALKVVSMEELKLQVLLEPKRTGETVAEVCARHGISRASCYRYRGRYLEEGAAGLAPRSRRPRVSPAQIEPTLEAQIVELRRRHRRWGGRRIHAELRRAGIEPPAAATIHRALRRNHLVAPQPPRRPKASRRFERELANDLWQIDGTQVTLADGEPAWIVDCLDDHARFLLAAIACASPTGEAAWACFVAASAAYGLPRQLLSDNHASFTGRLFGFEAAFERKRGELGVELINAAPAHPQPLGKLERFHRTLKEWLADEGPRRRPRAPAAPARPLPLPRQPGAAPPGNRRRDPGRALPTRRHTTRAPRRACARRGRQTSGPPTALAATQGLAQRRRQLRRPGDHARQALRRRHRPHRRSRRVRSPLPRREAHPRTRPRPHEALPAARPATEKEALANKTPSRMTETRGVSLDPRTHKIDFA
jgi:transposase InsO family protein